MATPKRHRRWYDKHRRLATHIDALAKLHRYLEFDTVKGLVDLVKKSTPDIMHGFVIPTDVEKWYRRWYDKDPTYWIVFNGLRHADRKMLDAVADYLDRHMAGIKPKKKK